MLAASVPTTRPAKSHRTPAHRPGVTSAAYGRQEPHGSLEMRKRKEREGKKKKKEKKKKKQYYQHTPVLAT